MCCVIIVYIIIYLYANVLYDILFQYIFNKCTLHALCTVPISISMIVLSKIKLLLLLLISSKFTLTSLLYDSCILRDVTSALFVYNGNGKQCLHLVGDTGGNSGQSHLMAPVVWVFVIAGICGTS